MNQKAKARRQELLSTKQNAISVTRTKEVSAGSGFKTIFYSVGSPLALISIPMVIIDGQWIAATALVAVLASLSVYVSRVDKMDPRVNPNKMSYNKGFPSLDPGKIKKDVDGRKLLASAPFKVDTDTTIGNVIYNTQDQVSDVLATHIIEESAFWKEGHLYVEQTIKETPYRMWESTFNALKDQESKMTSTDKNNIEKASK